MTTVARPAPLFIGSEIYRQTPYGGKHPLAIPRVSAVIDLLRALGWLPPGVYVDSPVATPAQLARFHDPAYIAAVQRAEAEGDLPDDLKRRHGLGRDGNPIHSAVYRRPATACGASLAAAGLLRHGGIVHAPAGGTHHGRRDRAAGFCYFNDPALAILAFLDQGLDRVLYVDVDAHHGDGVEEAFLGDPRVTTVSVHEDGRWPRTGATGVADGGTAVNLALPPALNDTEMDLVTDRVLRPMAERLRPQALVFQGGCDALADDPQSGQMLSNNALWRVLAELRDTSPRLLVLGGGGYNPWCVARCWTGYWAIINRIAIPDRLPAAARGVLAGLAWPRRQAPAEAWLTTLRDIPRPGPVRDAVASAVAHVATACGLHGGTPPCVLYSPWVAQTREERP